MQDKNLWSVKKDIYLFLKSLGNQASKAVKDTMKEGKY